MRHLGVQALARKSTHLSLSRMRVTAGSSSVVTPRSPPGLTPAAIASARAAADSSTTPSDALVTAIASATGTVETVARCAVAATLASSTVLHALSTSRSAPADALGSTRRATFEGPAASSRNASKASQCRFFAVAYAAASRGLRGSAMSVSERGSDDGSDTSAKGCDDGEALAPPPPPPPPMTRTCTRACAAPAPIRASLM